MKRIATLALALIAGTLLASSLASCSSTGTAGTGQVTTVGTATPVVTPTIGQAALDGLVAARTKQFVTASKAFRTCDKNIVNDSYSRTPCYKQAAAVTGVIQGLLADIEDVITPQDFAATKADLRGLVRAGNKVAQVCAKQNDQTCDQALAAFRAADQSVHWSLDSTP